MKKLYQPIMINKLKIKNRIMMSPCGINNTVDGCMTDQDVEFYRRRAAGGVGVIVIANMQWDKVRFNPNSGAHIIDRKSLPSLKKVTDAIHSEGCVVFAQLLHQGRYATLEKFQNVQSVAPSAVPSRYSKMEMPRELTTEEIKEFVKWQAEAALNALEAGFDGIEIETNSGYLFGQFFSPLTNKRTDEYGGDIYGRTRFLVETLQAVRAAIGPDVPLTIRIGGNDFVPGSCNSDDIADICEIIDKTGLIDGISVTGGWHEASVPLVTMELPHGTYAYLGKGIKARVHVPVMMGNRMNIPKAEELVEREDVDMVVMGRPLLCDPELPNKAMAGRVDLIRPCIGCNAGCLDAGLKRLPAGCISNPETNRETKLMDENGKLPTEVKSDNPQKILAIGAGPAGMEFARVASLRGHKVTIWEKRNRTIGTTLLAATPPRRYDIRYIGQWLERMDRELGVEFVLNKTATAEDIIDAVKNEGFDRVVLACGSNAFIPGFPIEEGSHVVQAWDVLEGKAELGKEIVVIGGGATGIETAEYIGEIGTLTADELRFMMIFDAEPHDKLKYLLNHGSKKVSVVEMQPKFATDINPGGRWSIMMRVRQLGITLYKSSKVVEIKKNGVVISNEEGEHFIPADTMVIAAGAHPNNGMKDELSAAGITVDTIGDATSVGKIPDAMGAGYNLAASI